MLQSAVQHFAVSYGWGTTLRQAVGESEKLGSSIEA